MSELGGNAVLEYRQHFDFEETNKTIVIRGYGTACLLSKVNSKTVMNFDKILSIFHIESFFFNSKA